MRGRRVNGGGFPQRLAHKARPISPPNSLHKAASGKWMPLQD